ncbi:DUF1254 domain-containing protein [Stenotrophomonas bentonitica]|uniref:DUF1254 domain-containing protein n=1 Tax=Stenotrophomonas bentonitica TaxID=1450134 RepID=UPI00345EA662
MSPTETTALPSGPVAGTPLIEPFVRDVARLAYVWGWPMVNLHNRHVVFSKVPGFGLGEGILPMAPINRLTMLTDYIKPEERAVATPNQDVAYGFGLLDLSEQPVVFQVPDFGERYWVYQTGDQRTDSLGGIGRMYDTQPGFYMIAGPGWNGETPSGIAKVLRSTTNLAYIIPRAFMDDTDADRAAIQPVLNQILAYPLSEFNGATQKQDWKSIPSLEDPSGSSKGGGGETQWVKPEAFFAELPAILKEVPPQRGEEALYALFQSILEAAEKDPNVASVLKQTAIDADRELMQPLHSYAYAGVPTANGWISPRNGAEFGTDYYSRAAAAKANIFVNPRRESAYFGKEYDSDGKRLNGANAYTLTFPKGGTPPVDGFWSLTLYDENHFFAPNAINRYSLGTKNKDLALNADGSLTLYVQHARPADDKASNWLPAPTGDFELFMRAYGPQKAILDNSWAPPPVERAP